MNDIALGAVLLMGVMEVQSVPLGKRCLKWADLIAEFVNMDTGAIPVELDLALAFERVSLSNRVGLGDALQFAQVFFLRVQYGYFWHQKASRRETVEALLWTVEQIVSWSCEAWVQAGGQRSVKSHREFSMR